MIYEADPEDARTDQEKAQAEQAKKKRPPAADPYMEPIPQGGPETDNEKATYAKLAALSAKKGRDGIEVEM